LPRSLHEAQHESADSTGGFMVFLAMTPFLARYFRCLIYNLSLWQTQQRYVRSRLCSHWYVVMRSSSARYLAICNLMKDCHRQGGYFLTIF